MSHFFALLSRMKYINRWGLMRNTQTENIREHSHEVAVIAHALAVIGNRYFQKNYDADRAASIALFHDADEIMTGDLPTPVQYWNPEIMRSYKSIGDSCRSMMLAMLPKEMRDDYEPLFFAKEEDEPLWGLVKAADKISAYIKCLEEKKAGNGEFDEAALSTFKAIKAMQMEEADYFLANFIDSFSLSLDMQKQI